MTAQTDTQKVKYEYGRLFAYARPYRNRIVIGIIFGLSTPVKASQPIQNAGGVR